MLIFHSRMDAVRWIEASRGLVRRYHWRWKIDWILVLGKPIRTISMKHTALSVLQFYAFVPHFPRVAWGCIQVFVGVVKLSQASAARKRKEKKKNLIFRWRFGSGTRVIREIPPVVSHNLSISPQPFPIVRKKSERFCYAFHFQLGAPLCTCTGASTDVIEPSQACWAREKWLDSQSTLKWSEF